jgi:hypothetical protein
MGCYKIEIVKIPSGKHERFKNSTWSELFLRFGA